MAGSTGEAVDAIILEPDDFAYLPGAPFTQDELDTALAVVRGAAGWHIAPEIEETVVVDVPRFDRVLRLPTLCLVSVDEVRDADTSTVIDSSLYRVSFPQAALRRRTGCWPRGYSRVEVDITHGYPTLPTDLYPVVAEAATIARRDQTIKSTSAGPFSVGWGADVDSLTANPLSTGSVMARYSLARPGFGIA